MQHFFQFARLFTLIFSALLILSCLNNEGSGEIAYQDNIFEVAVQHYRRASQPYCLDFNAGAKGGKPIRSISVDGKHGPFSLSQVSESFWNKNICAEGGADLPRPAAGDAYVFSAEYSGGETEDVTVDVTGVVDHFVELLYPGAADAVSTATPGFKWTAPKNAAGAAMSGTSGFQLAVYTTGGQRVLISESVQPAQDTLKFDPRSSGQPDLNSGQTYELRIYTGDSKNSRWHNTSVSMFGFQTE